MTLTSTPPSATRAGRSSRRRALWTLALASPLLLALTQLRWLPQDEGVLLQIGQKTIDINGVLADRWQSALRRCDKVQRWHAGSALWLQAGDVLAAHSPPASAAARPLQVLSWQQDGIESMLVEVVWDAVPTVAPLNPAIVPLQKADGRWQVLQAGVWSGDTGPWHTPVFVRRWLTRQVPTLPAPLVQCLDVQAHLFGG